MFPAVIDFSSFDGVTGFALNGAAAGDRIGFSDASAGDVNADGIDDLIVGADGADPNGTSSGRSCGVFGASGGFAYAIELSALDGATDFALNGVAPGSGAADELGPGSNEGMGLQTDHRECVRGIAASSLRNGCGSGLCSSLGWC